MSVYRKPGPIDVIELTLLEEAIQDMNNVRNKESLQKSRAAEIAMVEAKQAELNAEMRLNYFVKHVSPKIKRAARKGKGNIRYSGSWWRMLNVYDGSVLMMHLSKQGFKCTTINQPSVYYDTTISIAWE
jgi:hypothetical protein